MFLSACEIRSEVESGRLVIDPFLPELLKPASYVLRLSDRWRQWKSTNSDISPWSAQIREEHLEPVIESPGFLIPPLGFVLAPTIEKVGLPNNLAGILSTISHLARFGLSAHLNSFLVSPAFGKQESTALTLELFSINPAPIRVEVGMPICHLAFVKMSSPSSGSKMLQKSVYEGRDPLAAPKLREEFIFLKANTYAINDSDG